MILLIIDENNKEYITSFPSEWTDDMIYIALQKMDIWYQKGFEKGIEIGRAS